MKKIIILFFLVLSLSACSEEKEHNEYGFMYEAVTSESNQVIGNKIDRIGYSLKMDEKAKVFLQLALKKNNVVEEELLLEKEFLQNELIEFGFSYDALTKDDSIELVIDLDHTYRSISYKNILKNYNASDGYVAESGYLTKEYSSIVKYIISNSENENGFYDEWIIELEMRIE